MSLVSDSVFGQKHADGSPCKAKSPASCRKIPIVGPRHGGRSPGLEGFTYVSGNHGYIDYKGKWHSAEGREVFKSKSGEWMVRPNEEELERSRQSAWYIPAREPMPTQKSTAANGSSGKKKTYYIPELNDDGDISFLEVDAENYEKFMNPKMAKIKSTYNPDTDTYEHTWEDTGKKVTEYKDEDSLRDAVHDCTVYGGTFDPRGVNNVEGIPFRPIG